MLVQGRSVERVILIGKTEYYGSTWKGSFVCNYARNNVT